MRIFHTYFNNNKKLLEYHSFRIILNVCCILQIDSKITKRVLKSSKGWKVLQRTFFLKKFEL